VLTKDTISDFKIIDLNKNEVECVSAGNGYSVLYIVIGGVIAGIVAPAPIAVGVVSLFVLYNPKNGS